MTLNLYLGCMFAGKTTKLLYALENALISGKKCLLVTFKQDTRYLVEKEVTGIKFMTHENQITKSRKAIEQSDTLDIVSTLSIGAIMSTIIEKKYDVIGIDEGQFYGDLPDHIKTLLSMQIEIHVSALDGDHEQKPWKVISDLIPYADKYKKYKAICKLCKKEKAIYTKKINTGSKSSEKIEGVEVDIGGDDKYTIVCRKCH